MGRLVAVVEVSWEDADETMVLEVVEILALLLMLVVRVVAVTVVLGVLVTVIEVGVLMICDYACLISIFFTMDSGVFGSYFLGYCLAGLSFLSSPVYLFPRRTMPPPNSMESRSFSKLDFFLLASRAK